MSKEIGKLVKHMFWADNEVWKVVLANESSKKDDKIKQLLFHSHFTQHAFLNVWRSEQFEFLQNEDFVDINSVKSFYDKLLEELIEHFSKIDTLKLDDLVDIPWSKYYAKDTGKAAAPVNLLETITQVVMHSTYHRAQINARLRELNIEPPLVDFIVWLWSGRPSNE